MNNVQATQRLLEALVGIPIQRFVYASSSSVYGDHVPLPMREETYLQPLSPYGVSKLAAEHLTNLYFENHGVPAVSVRYFTVYGPRQRPDMAFCRFFSAAMADQPIVIYGDGEQTRDFTFVGDAVAGTLAAGRQGRLGAVYNIGGGSRVTMNHEVHRFVDHQAVQHGPGCRMRDGGARGSGTVQGAPVQDQPPLFHDRWHLPDT